MDLRPAQGLQDEGSPPRVTPEIAAEASVWIARLHGPDRSPAMERECLEWQGRSAANRLAFERCTDIWEAVPRVTLGDAYATASSRRSPSEQTGGPAHPGRTRRRLVLAMLLIGGGGLGVHIWRDAGVYTTRVGGQQMVLLDDGTRMSLNTDTRVQVQMDASMRSVSVRGGEALFEVAKDEKRPFVVHVAGSEVVALGTVFSVRLASSGAAVEEALDVTLIEGQITVRPAAGSQADGISPAGPVSMQAGQRIRLVKADGKSTVPARLQVDRPSLEEVIAWKRNEVIFDDVSLADAAAEMNRYSRTPLVLLGGPKIAQLRVSGLYRAGDSAGFARAVAALHGLVAREPGGRLELAPPP